LSALLLDTTFLVDTERGGVEIDEAIGDEDDVAIAALTIAELLVGVELASGRRRASRASYVEDIIESVPILDYDRHVAVEHGALLLAVRRQGRPRDAHDLIIAATARATSRTVITADHHAFEDLPGVAIISHG
jgi:tRNA(fMet)-specific endonuclease VapC